ncbi:MAG: protein kinase [Planctomycetes bacterium]|nr:protein kinase [Planctomycetota bacterium]
MLPRPLRETAMPNFYNDLHKSPPPIPDSGIILPDDAGNALIDLGKTILAAPSQLPAPHLASNSAFPKQHDSRYQIREEIARGGVGIIYKAIDKSLDREIAFKVLLELHQNKPEVRRRFQDEASISGRLQHPGIVPVYEFGLLSDARPFIVMGLVQGQTLEKLLAERTQPEKDLSKFLKIFERVCQTVAYAHSEGIIHRDLKPANIMVSPFGVVNVMDWGVAKILNGIAPSEDDVPWSIREPSNIELRSQATDDAPAGNMRGTQLGSVMGTLAYMAPEQARGEIDRLDRRSDVFGLGAILCEILTGQPPYTAPNSAIAHKKAASADLEDAYSRLARCGGERELIELAKRCLAAQSSERYADAGELAFSLTSYLESQIRQAEHDLVRFFELSMDLFCIASFDGYFHRINSNFSRALGHPEREFLTRPFFDFVHPEDHQATRDEMAKLAQGLPVVQFRNRYRNAQGDYHWFEWTAKAIPEENVIFAVARDISHRVKPSEHPASVDL